MGADHGALGISPSGRPEDYRWIAQELPTAFFDAYTEMAPHDFVRQSVVRQPNIVLRDQDMVSRVELETNMMYLRAREVQAPLEQVMAVMLHKDGWQSGLSLYRAKRRPFSLRERAALQHVTPAMTNAVRICHMFGAAVDWGAALEASLDNRGASIVLITLPEMKLERIAGAAGLMQKWFEPHERRNGHLPEALMAVLAQVAIPLVQCAPGDWTRCGEDATLRVSFIPIPGHMGQAKWMLKMREIPHAIAIPAQWQDKFTLGERKVASRLLRGWDNQLIADDLGLAISTVKAHVESIFDKTGISSRAALIVRAVELNRE